MSIETDSCWTQQRKEDGVYDVGEQQQQQQGNESEAEGTRTGTTNGSGIRSPKNPAVLVATSAASSSGAAAVQTKGISSIGSKNNNDNNNNNNNNNTNGFYPPPQQVPEGGGEEQQEQEEEDDWMIDTPRRDTASSNDSREEEEQQLDLEDEDEEEEEDVLRSFGDDNDEDLAVVVSSSVVWNNINNNNSSNHGGDNSSMDDDTLAALFDKKLIPIGGGGGATTTTTTTTKAANPVGMISGQHHSHHHRFPSTILEESYHDDDDDDLHHNYPSSPKNSSRKKPSPSILQRKRSFSLNDLPALIITSSSSFETDTDMMLHQQKDNDKLKQQQQQQQQQQDSQQTTTATANATPQTAIQTVTAGQTTAAATKIHSSKPELDRKNNALVPIPLASHPEKQQQQQPAPKQQQPQQQPQDFLPYYSVTRIFARISRICLKRHYGPLSSATWIGFWALLMVTCANYVLTPMRDAIALAVGVQAMPQLTLASTVLAFCSSVPIGWLFEAPDPNRRRLFKRIGLTRGETQGTSLALFYRCFALILLSYAIGFPLLEWLKSNQRNVAMVVRHARATLLEEEDETIPNIAAAAVSRRRLTQALSLSYQYIKATLIPDIPTLLAFLGQALYIAFFLVVHLMKLHSISLVWGVTSEAMEYEETARLKLKKNTGMRQQQQQQQQQQQDNIMQQQQQQPEPTRLQRLALIGFGGTVGGIFGSVLASSMAQILYLPGLLVLAAILLEISAELSIELGRVMLKHWEQEQHEQILLANAAAGATTTTNITTTTTTSSTAPLDTNNFLDTSMRRSVSLGSMKRVASGNSLNRVRSETQLHQQLTIPSSSSTTTQQQQQQHETHTNSSAKTATTPPNIMDNNNNMDNNDNTFFQRLLRGVTAILRSRLLMAIFTYNALYASTTVLLSFERAALVANRNQHDEAASYSKEADMAFLANINIVSSVAIFALQASGAGASLAHYCGPQGTLALMPMIRLVGVMALAWWHHTSQGKPPNLLVFLVVDECCKIMNLAVAKPVRENLWRGLSNEARYEAKPIVDTLANRWGGGSAAFLVSTLNKTLDLLGVVPAADNGSRMVFGFPPILFLCILVAAWWAVVSADLGQIRRRIDVELKKRQ